MKKFLINLLIFFSLALCGFIAFQWVREAKLRAEIQSLHVEMNKKSGVVSELEGTLKTMKSEITRLDQLKVELTENAKTNRLEIGQLNLDLKKANGDAARLSKQVDSYKTALDKANENIQTQNENLKKMAGDSTKLAEERNEAITKNNKLVEQYNELVKQFNQLQEQLAARKPATP